MNNHNIYKHTKYNQKYAYIISCCVENTLKQSFQIKQLNDNNSHRHCINLRKDEITIE